MQNGAYIDYVAWAGVALVFLSLVVYASFSGTLLNRFNFPYSLYVN